MAPSLIVQLMLEERLQIGGIGPTQQLNVMLEGSISSPLNFALLVMEPSLHVTVYP